MFLVFSDRVPVSAALVTLPALPSIIWQAYGLATIQGHHQFRALHFFRLTPPALYTVGLVVTLLVFQQSVTAVMAAWSISYVVGAAGTQIFIQVDARRNPHKEPEGGPSRLPDRTKMFRFGAIAFLGASSPLEVFRVDQLAVGLVLTTVDLALYTTALSFCNFPRFLTLALGLNAYARISAIKTVEQQNRLIIRYFLVGITSAALVSAPLALFAAPLINLTFGPEFSDATTITQLLLGATVLLCGRRILSDCLRGAGLPGAGSVAEITSLVALVPAALIFVPPYGLTGFGLAMITSYMAGLIAICVYSARGWNRELSSDRPS